MWCCYTFGVSILKQRRRSSNASILLSPRCFFTISSLIGFLIQFMFLFNLLSLLYLTDAKQLHEEHDSSRRLHINHDEPQEHFMRKQHNNGYSDSVTGQHHKPHDYPYSNVPRDYISSYGDNKGLHSYRTSHYAEERGAHTPHGDHVGVRDDATGKQEDKHNMRLQTTHDSVNDDHSGLRKEVPYHSNIPVYNTIVNEASPDDPPAVQTAALPSSVYPPDPLEGLFEEHLRSPEAGYSLSDISGVSTELKRKVYHDQHIAFHNFKDKSLVFPCYRLPLDALMKLCNSTSMASDAADNVIPVPKSTNLALLYTTHLSIHFLNCDRAINGQKPYECPEYSSGWRDPSQGRSTSTNEVSEGSHGQSLASIGDSDRASLKRRRFYLFAQYIPSTLMTPEEGERCFLHYRNAKNFRFLRALWRASHSTEAMCSLLNEKALADTMRASRESLMRTVTNFKDDFPKLAALSRKTMEAIRASAIIAETQLLHAKGKIDVHFSEISTTVHSIGAAQVRAVDTVGGIQGTINDIHQRTTEGFLRQKHHLAEVTGAANTLNQQADMHSTLVYKGGHEIYKVILSLSLLQRTVYENLGMFFAMWPYCVLLVVSFVLCRLFDRLEGSWYAVFMLVVIAMLVDLRYFVNPTTEEVCEMAMMVNNIPIPKAVIDTIFPSLAGLRVKIRPNSLDSDFLSNNQEEISSYKENICEVIVTSYSSQWWTFSGPRRDSMWDPAGESAPPWDGNANHQLSSDGAEKDDNDDADGHYAPFSSHGDSIIYNRNECVELYGDNEDIRSCDDLDTKGSREEPSRFVGTTVQRSDMIIVVFFDGNSSHESSDFDTGWDTNNNLKSHDHISHHRHKEISRNILTNLVDNFFQSFIRERRNAHLSILVLTITLVCGYMAYYYIPYSRIMEAEVYEAIQRSDVAKSLEEFDSAFTALVLSRANTERINNTPPTKHKRLVLQR